MPRVSKRSAGGSIWSVALELGLAQCGQPRRSVQVAVPVDEAEALPRLPGRRHRAAGPAGRAHASCAPIPRRCSRTRPKSRVRSKRRFSRSRTLARALLEHPAESEAAQRTPPQRARTRSSACRRMSASLRARDANAALPSRRASCPTEPQQRQRIVEQSRALQLQFLQAAVAELFQISSKNSAEIRDAPAVRSNFRQRAVAQSRRTGRVGRRRCWPWCTRAAGSAQIMPPSPQIRSFAAFLRRRRTT